MTEWPKVHDWKSCVLKGTEGSNPSPSAAGPRRCSFFSPGRSTSTCVMLWSRVTRQLRTPPGPEGSNGSGNSGCLGPPFLRATIRDESSLAVFSDVIDDSHAPGDGRDSRHADHFGLLQQI